MKTRYIPVYLGVWKPSMGVWEPGMGVREPGMGLWKPGILYYTCTCIGCMETKYGRMGPRYGCLCMDVSIQVKGHTRLPRISPRQTIMPVTLGTT